MSSNLDSFMAKISIGLSESKILSSSMCADRLLIFSEARLDAEQFALSLVFKVRIFGTRKWPFALLILRQNRP